jgi:hypothetical protein
MFSPLAATSPEFIGLVRRIGKLLAYFHLTMYSSYRRLPLGHDLVSSSCCWPRRPSSGRRSVYRHRRERPLRSPPPAREASPSLYEDDTNYAVDARDIDEGSGTPSLETARTTPSTMPESATAVVSAIAKHVLCKLLLPCPFESCSL